MQKRVAYFGDSITDPRNSGSKLKYWNFLQDWLGITPYVYAVSGRQWDDIPRQAGDLSEMIWSIADQIALLSTYFELHPGDLIFTGTPSGVGAVERGQAIEAAIEGFGVIRLIVV
jgi:2-keto-4-pentenoate hydratase/2-oxohepta-3-ene-1,7-dioic acid hydratase in catechol pathway